MFEFVTCKDSKKIDWIFITLLILVSFSVFTYFFVTHGETMIYLDSYLNYQKTIAISEGIDFGKRTTSAGPFFIFYSSIYGLISDYEDPVIIMRMINILFSVQLVVFFYLIARKILNPFFSLVGAILSSFIPVVTVYSGTLHSEIFAFSMGFACLYFAINPNTRKKILLASCFFILSASRLDIFIVFSIPYFIGLSYYISQKTRFPFYILVIIFVSFFFISGYFTVEKLGIFYKDVFFDYSLANQIVSMLNYETVSSVIMSSVEISGKKFIFIEGDEGLNFFYQMIILFGVLYFLIKFGKSLRSFLNQYKKFDDKIMTTILLSVTFAISVASLAIFHIPITLIDATIEVEKILPRYLLGMHLLMTFSFIYGLSVISSTYQFIVGKNKKSFVMTPNKKQNISTSEIYSTKNKRLLNYSYLISYFFIVIILIVFSMTLWDSSVKIYENDSTQIEVYKEASQWLSVNLSPDEKVFLPMKDVFWSLNPELKPKTYEYIHIWDSLDYVLRINTTDEQISNVRNALKQFIHDDKNNVRYLVFSWNDLHAKISTGVNAFNLPNFGVCQEFDDQLMEVKRFNFELPHSNWKNNLVICQVTSYYN